MLGDIMGSSCPFKPSALLLPFSVLLGVPLLHANLESGASFFGDGFVEIPLVETYTTIQLHVQFYTSRRHAILFLAAGRTDYLLLHLQMGVLEARIKWGKVEQMIQAPKGQPLLNDLVIHEADLLVENGEMSLTVDGRFNNSMKIFIPPFRLDIDYGLYVGGLGDRELPYELRTSLPFRGCLHAVTFNGHDVLSTLASGSSAKRTHRVREGCSEEFSIGPDVPLGFPGPHSYMAFPGWLVGPEGTIAFVIATDVKNTPLIFQSWLESDFVYVEIADGRLRGVVEKGSGPAVLHNNVYLSDDQEHYVKVHVDNRRFEILVDYYASQTSSKGAHHSLVAQGPLFIGGLDEKASRQLKALRLPFSLGDGYSNSSLAGCVEDLRINREKRGLRDAVITRGVAAGCEEPEPFAVYEDTYEQDEAPTSPPPDYWQGPVTEPCHPDPKLPPIFANLTKLLHISPLVVAEEGTAFLEWRHTQPTIDLDVANIRQSQVLFKVTTDPRHGQLELDISGVRNRRKFTLLDVATRKVKYVHDGSEGPMDQVLLEVTVTSRRGVPECLWQGQTYLLPVKINPVNDAPEVVFPNGDLMVVLEHTSKRLSPDVIQALDEDTSCDNLRFQLLGGKRTEEGYLEFDFHPGVPIEEFSCTDLEAGHMVYVHQSGPALPLIFQVNDGMAMSPVATLRVVTVEPDIRVRNNTGLVVSQGGVVPVTPANLSMETNAVQQEVPILYRLTVPLQYGEIQKQGTLGGEWKEAESFHQQDIERGRIRYFSTATEYLVEDVTETVPFVVQVGQKTLRNNTFLVRVKRATIMMKTMLPLQMKNERQRNITAAELEAALEDSNPSPEFFRYVIIQPPRKGNLELGGNRLTEGFGFTQEDVQNHLLSYSATIRDSKESEDSFRFRVTAEAHYSPVYTYTIHIGGDPDAPTLTNILLTVLEGGQGVISKDHLFVKTVNSMDYTYEVIDGPTHGKLIWRTSGGRPSGEETITKFTNEDILQGHLAYQHDDSETLEDDIPFVAIRQGEGSLDPGAEEVRGVFRVSVQPVNDHAPVQVVNKVFNVVRHGQRLLTTEDIAFADKDSDFSDAQLVLVRKDILFGSIIAVDNRSLQVYRFTQDDLRKKKILFVHSGADRGWIQFQVSDGLHQAATLLEVQASDPYLKIRNHTGLVVHQGGQATVDSSVLSVETNMDIRNNEDVLFHVITPPRWGVVLHGGQEVSSFSQRDLLMGEVLYRHNGSKTSQDWIHFSVEMNQVVVEGTLRISISLDSHPGPLNLVHHEKIHILQGEAVAIENSCLLVQHEDVPPRDIVYTVTVPPFSGSLVALSQGLTSEEPPNLDPIETFTQEDIDEGKVLYLHSDPEIQSDQFTVDVDANGLDLLEGVVVSLEILPISVPMEVHNITVPEGGSKTISMDVLNIPNTYFSALNVEFAVLKGPEHGILQNTERPEGSLQFFSWFEVEQQLIQYVHDGSESFADGFTVVANVSEVNQQSQARTIHIEVIPSNDEAPVVVVNRELQMPEGSTAEITPAHLRTEDEDTPPEGLVYSIRTPVNGKVVLTSSPQSRALRFTQAQINSRLVHFIHEGALEGGFSFDISDGENMSPGHFFAVVAHRKPTITLENKQDLSICPGSSQPITSHNLRAMTNDGAEAQSIVYIIERGPTFGRLVHGQKGSDGGDLKNFTQAEVDNGEIFYQQEMPEQPFWLLQDVLHFRVSSPSTVTEPLTLRLWVSFQFSCPLRSTQLWRNKGLEVPEAQSAVINASVLDASNLLAQKPESERAAYDVVFLVTELPQHGSLSLPDGPVNRKHPYFLQSDLVHGGLEYAHHGYGTLGDHFRFKAWLRHVAVKSLDPPPKGDEFVVSGTVNITVSDSNEISPQLARRGAVLQVLHNSPVVLSREHLDVTDPDSSPDEIKYDILSGSSNGFVANVHDKQVPITRFTQADINAGNVMFIANGTSSPGALDLSISDGRNPPVFTSLEVMVLPATTWATNQVPVETPQDVNMVVLSQEHLLGASGQGEPNTFYRLIREPQFGQVRVGGNPARDFSQKQVDDGEVVFTFTDFTSPKDEFQFIATAGGVNISGTVNVTVRALVKIQEDILWPRGTTVLLDNATLDASELANKTKSVPVFKILRAPRGSHFVKVSGDERTHPVSIDAFDQHDLERGKVALEIWEAEDTGPSPQQDNFLFELVAEGVPPALEYLTYATEAFNSSATYRATLLHTPDAQDSDRSPTAQGITPSSQTLTRVPETPGRSSSKPPVLPTTWAVPGTTTSASPAERGKLLSFIEANMFSIILPICLILLLLALILPLLFYLHKRNKTGKHDVQGTPPKYKNGSLVDQETFRKTDPNQAIPLTTVNTLEAKGPLSKGAGGQQDPELLQYCRTSNPALKNSQYWV